MYFIQKRGVYPKGIYWIGEDKEVGLSLVHQFAERDQDGYHSWILFQYVHTTFAALGGDAWVNAIDLNELPHQEILSIRKGEQDGSRANY